MALTGLVVCIAGIIAIDIAQYVQDKEDLKNA